MPNSRRELLAAGAAAALSCFLPKSVDAGLRRDGNRTAKAAPAEAAHQALLDSDPLLTRSVLAGQLRTRFVVQDRKPVVLSLVEVGDLPSARTTGTEGSDLCFSALWSGPQAAPLAQKTYRLDHPQLGSFSVFLVPVGPSARVRYYEAIFNRVDA